MRASRGGSELSRLRCFLPRLVFQNKIHKLIQSLQALHAVKLLPEIRPPTCIYITVAPLTALGDNSMHDGGSDSILLVCEVDRGNLSSAHDMQCVMHPG